MVSYGVDIKTKSKKLAEQEAEAAEHQLEKPIMEYNNKTWKSWKDLEKLNPDVEIPHGVEAPETRKQTFLSRVDLTQGPIERKVTIMVRMKAKDNTTQNSPGKKEYLIYYEDWSGKNWMGNNLKVGENIEGVYNEQLTEKIIKYDENKGPEVVGYRRSGEKVIHYIPFSKEAVDKIIADRNQEEDKGDITFVVKTPERRDHFTYDEFVNFSWEQLEDILMMDGGAEAARAERIRKGQGSKVKTSNKLDFKPS